MLKYELKKYILKPSVIICLAVLLLVNLVKVLEIYCQGSGRQILFSGKGRIEISKDVLYEKYGGEITQEKIESLKAELAARRIRYHRRTDRKYIHGLSVRRCQLNQRYYFFIRIRIALH